MSPECAFVLLFFSVCGIEAYTPHRYHFVNENKNWSEAQAYCRVNYTDLATINNMMEMMKLNNTLQKETPSQAWIGLYRNETGEWQWSLSGQRLYSDGDTYTNWASGQPDNIGGNQYCGQMCINNNPGDAKWNDHDCNGKYMFVCYDENNTNTNRYRLITYQLSWYDAQAYCRENYTDLASVMDETENNEISNLINNNTDLWNQIKDGGAKAGGSGDYYHVWIGLFKNFWKWSDQSNCSFRYWSSDEPSAGVSCSVVSESEQYHWSDEDCVENLPFICHENKFVLINQNLSWKDALRYCRNNHHDLVSVVTEEIQLWVKEVVQNASTDYVWLGLRHTCALGFWYWVTGEMICYQNWAPGNGTGLEDCSSDERTGAVQSGGEQQWISLPQSYKLNFICSNYEG